MDIFKDMGRVAVGTFHRSPVGNKVLNICPCTCVAGGAGAGTVGRGVMYCLNPCKGAIKWWLMAGGTTIGLSYGMNIVKYMGVMTVSAVKHCLGGYKILNITSGAVMTGSARSSAIGGGVVNSFNA